MSVVDLTALDIRRAVPVPQEFGTKITPPGGGQTMRVDRLGNRWSFQFETPMMPVEPDGRLWSALLDDAKINGALVRIRIPGFNPVAPGSPVVAADTPAGRLVPIAGLTPYYVIRRGQWLSIIVDGQRYLDKAMDEVAADASGNATVRIKYLLRAPLSAGDVVELGAPKIQGTIDGDFGGAWEDDWSTAFSFTVSEDA